MNSREQSPTLKLVKSLLENYQDNTAMTMGLQKLNQEQLNDTLKEEVLILKQQLQYLESSINCLNRQDQELISRLYKTKQTLSKCGRDMYMSKASVSRKREKILEKIANYYEKIAKVG